MSLVPRNLLAPYLSRREDGVNIDNDYMMTLYLTTDHRNTASIVLMPALSKSRMIGDLTLVLTGL